MAETEERNYAQEFKDAYFGNKKDIIGLAAARGLRSGLESEKPNEVSVTRDNLHGMLVNKLGIDSDKPLKAIQYTEAAEAALKEETEAITAYIHDYKAKIAGMLPSGGLEKAVADIAPVKLEAGSRNYQIHNEIVGAHEGYQKMHALNAGLEDKTVDPSKYVSSVADMQTKRIEKKLKARKGVKKETVKLWTDLTRDIITSSPQHAVSVGHRLESDMQTEFNDALKKAAKEPGYTAAEYARANISYQKNDLLNVDQIAAVFKAQDAVDKEKAKKK